MKKLIAISVVLAMFATGVAFAETTVSGTIELGISLAVWDLNEAGRRADINKPINEAIKAAKEANAPAAVIQELEEQLQSESAGDIIATGGSVQTTRIQIATSNDDGTYSGLMRYNGSTFDKAYVWWKPVTQVGIFAGRDCDALWEAANIVGWGFGQGDKLGATVEDYKFNGSSFTGGFSTGSDIGLGIEIAPIEGFAFRTGIDFSGNIALANRFPNYMFFQAAYGLSGIGNVAVSYDMGKNSENNEQVNISFFSDQIVDGLGFELGLGYGLETEIIKIGLGVHFQTGDLGVKFRGFGNIGQVTEEDYVGAIVYGHPSVKRLGFGVDLLPYYKLSLFEVRFLLGFRGNNFGTAPDNKDLNWLLTVNPYIVKDLGIGFLSFGVIYQKSNAKLPIGDSPDGQTDKGFLKVALGFAMDF
jgi:hypothetical protein